MIGYLRGLIIFSCDKHVILNVGGVGYKIYISPDTASGISEEETVSLWTHLVVKEDVLDLYGFSTMQELNLFKLLIGVSGIGPKGALGVMSVASVEALCSAIGAGDTSYLTKVSGIGKKNAQKIIIELKDKLGGITTLAESAQTTRREDVDVVEALRSLGYKDRDAREVLQELSPDIKGVNQKITAALKLLGNNK